VRERRRRFVRAAVAFAVAIGPIRARAESTAQAYPARALRLLVPFPAGGAMDALARLMSD
jgi:tripartite-type tricarboxylate transporter receptor subunit TctC